MDIDFRIVTAVKGTICKSTPHNKQPNGFFILENDNTYYNVTQ